MTAEHTNRLANETSPYLLQHAHNPVDWYPWGPEALERARRESKPIFLSIGYAACHWCHVMEHESFEDEATAGELNEHYVAIKVDREERPDLDAIYMDAVQAMTGQGGWPMSVFLTPEGKPFYGGTYFPNERRYGMPSFRDVLAGIERAWREQRDDLEAAGAQLAAAIAAQMEGQLRPPARRESGPDTEADAGDRGTTVLVPSILEAAVLVLERSFDATNGGWGKAPKFPQPMTIEFLLREHLATGDAPPLAMARRTLDRMAAGGIRDHLGGGFARYSTDERWLVPHFEKMLYDNGQLARVYLHAFQVTGDERYREVVRETLDHAERDMLTAEGAFAASLDADTQGEEGATYVWAEAEVREVAGGDSALFQAAYGVTERGNWEGHNILSRVVDDDVLARDFATTPSEVSRRLRAVRAALLERRSAKPQPARDDKVLAAWNGLMLAPFAEAARVLAEPQYRATAERAADFLLAALRTPEGRLKRSWKDGRAAHDAVLEDYADLADGLLELYEATFEERWFVAARGLIDEVLARFAAPGGGFFDTAEDHEVLIARPRSLEDNALPSGSSAAALVLLRFAALTGEGRYRSAAEGALAAVAAAASRYPAAFANWLSAIRLSLTPIDEVAIVGDSTDPAAEALVASAFGRYRPAQVVALTGDPSTTQIPLLRERTRIGGSTTAYVCRGFACQRPVTDARALEAQLSAQ